MERLIKKADVLIEALPYIQKFRGGIVVVKFGGSAIEQKDRYEGILEDVILMECVGMLPVVVHGGGKAISRRMEEKGIKPQFKKGLRVTDEATVAVVREVLNTNLNPGIVETIRRKGGRAEGIFGEKIFEVVRHTETDPDTGEKLDWGFVGTPREVRVRAIKDCLKRETIPVITPIGVGPDGKYHNINADTAAAAVAKALRARKLVYISDVPGLLRDPKDQGSLIPTLRAGDVAGLVRKGVIDGGMLPKIRSGIEALRSGVRKIHLVDGRVPHSMLLEIFTDTGVGTEIILNEQRS